MQSDTDLKRLHRINKRKAEFGDFLFVVPAITILIIFCYYPLCNLFRISFTDWNLIASNYKYVGMKNYVWLFNGSGGPQLLSALKVTFTYTLWQLFIAIIIGMLLAALFNKMTRGYAIMRSMVLMPNYIAISTAAVVFIWILNGDYGILNYALSFVGLAKVDWLNSTSTALSCVIVLTAWGGVGYDMIIYISAMQGISKDYYEAASLDGANAFNQFRYITVPLLSPTTLFLLVTEFIASMKVFQSIDVMTGGGPYSSTNVMVYWIYKLGFVDFRVDRAAAVSCIFFLILMAMTILTMRVSNKSVNYDS
jgi:ABC-type sugar transport system permease subunit